MFFDDWVEITEWVIDQNWPNWLTKTNETEFMLNHVHLGEEHVIEIVPSSTLGNGSATTTPISESQTSHAQIWWVCFKREKIVETEQAVELQLCMEGVFVTANYFLDITPTAQVHSCLPLQQLTLQHTVDHVWMVQIVWWLALLWL